MVIQLQSAPVPLLSRKWPYLDYVVRSAPTDAGLFALWSGEELLFAGIAASGIRGELLRHFRGDVSPITKNADHFSWELSREPEKRLKEVLAQFHAINGRPPRAQNP